ncbi:cyclic nucleotide-binding domain protein (macronuclear) [Tetrahymena thermophila SB210]|uniref:Cyclic nucleotide-binding domain protein n=1 Tax=Tetrahymena thermophila (strain SB210) TaxID=312017 RepID=I7MGH9_TETTS|nr:cyclic nucleotide-binding domain protein [Tetrahymena thermophila SB210]EAS01463.2 cyclic nucleotide-binding domain protein [Tetrahymena thermophila SB210]|eukprot:XP_001021709.2 cyclic nucleotide-binding domain protein [Tetrahymena thermophila SB210]
MSQDISRMEKQKEIYKKDDENSYKQANQKRDDSLQSFRTIRSSFTGMSKLDDESSHRKSHISIKKNMLNPQIVSQKLGSFSGLQKIIGSDQNIQVSNNQYNFQIIENSYVSKKTNESEQEKGYLNIDQHSKNLQVSSNFDITSKYKKNSECASRISMRSNRSQQKNQLKNLKTSVKEPNSSTPNKNNRSQQHNAPDQLRINMVFKVKSKFRSFFQKFTYSGRAKQSNFQKIRAFIKDKSDSTNGVQLFTHRMLGTCGLLVTAPFQMFLIGHVISCLYYVIAIIDIKYFISESDSWLNNPVIEDKQWWKVYIYAIHWTFTLMNTGSNEANSVLGYYFTVITMLITCIVYGYMLSTVSEILSEMNKFSQTQRRDINTINTYMHRKNISVNLQRMVNLDLENYHLRSIKQQSDEELNVLEKISHDLNDSLKLEYNKNIIQKIKYLVDNFSPESIEQISLKAQEMYYSPNQVIFGEDEITNSSLMFIVDGKVGIFQKYKKSDIRHPRIKFIAVDWSKQQKPDQDQKLLCTLATGTSFGELNFFSGMARQASAVSQDFTTILQIDRQDFIDIVKKNEKDFETFCYFKDSIMLYNDLRSVNRKCAVCNSFVHLENHCPLVHLNKDNPYIYMRFQYSDVQERNQDIYDRYRRKRTLNAKEIMEDVLEAIDKVWENLDEFIKKGKKNENQDDDDEDDGSKSNDDDESDQENEDMQSQNKESQFYYFENDVRREEQSAISTEFQLNQNENHYTSKLTADELSKNQIDDQGNSQNKFVSRQNNSLVPQRSSMKRLSVGQQMIERTKTNLQIQHPELFNKQNKINENLMWYFDKLKVYTHYFPESNFQNRLTRFHIQRNRYLKKKYGKNITQERQKTTGQIFNKSEKNIVKQIKENS